MHNNKNDINYIIARVYKIIIIGTALQIFSDETFSGTHIHTTHESSTVMYHISAYTDLNPSYVDVHIDVL